MAHDPLISALWELAALQDVEKYEKTCEDAIAEIMRLRKDHANVRKECAEQILEISKKGKPISLPLLARAVETGADV